MDKANNIQELYGIRKALEAYSKCSGPACVPRAMLGEQSLLALAEQLEDLDELSRMIQTLYRVVTTIHQVKAIAMKIISYQGEEMAQKSTIRLYYNAYELEHNNIVSEAVPKEPILKNPMAIYYRELCNVGYENGEKDKTIINSRGQNAFQWVRALQNGVNSINQTGKISHFFVCSDGGGLEKLNCYLDFFEENIYQASFEEFFVQAEKNALTSMVLTDTCRPPDYAPLT